MRQMVVVTCGICGKQKSMRLKDYNKRKKANPTGYTPVCSNRCKGIHRIDIKFGRVKKDGKEKMHLV